jgi:UDP-2,3-diacylglucosamine hydrolase
MPPAAAVFISDAHLGSEPPPREAPREERLIRFLESLPGQARALYVVGDLFDFWFEYRAAVPRRYVRLLGVLRAVRERGVRVVYLAGNHDFWLGPFLRDDVGLETAEGPLAVELDGRRVWLHHGDGLIGGDLGYRMLKRVIRHPLSIALYGWIHPDIGLPFAHWCSRLSRGSRERRPLDGDRLFREIAEPRFREGFDAVMVGHFHHAYERREGNRLFCVLGDWMERFTYAELRDGAFSLRVWPEQADADAGARVRTGR